GGPRRDDAARRSPLAESVLLGGGDGERGVRGGLGGIVHERVEQGGEGEGGRPVDGARGLIGPREALRGERAHRGEIAARHFRERRRAERVPDEIEGRGKR